MTNLSFFAKRASLAKGDKHLLRGSSLIRGEQIAAYIGAKLNPQSGYENDVCIYVKPGVQGLYSGSIKLAKRAYIDVIDSDNLVLYVRKNPQVGVIACSQIDYKNLSALLPNKVVLIPQHHCNFERLVRNRNQVTTVGVIGAPGFLAKLPANFEKKLTPNGLNLLPYFSFHNRQDVINFYQKIDIQIVWRPWPSKLNNPLKIVNAASFGIPTIAYPENTFDEVAGCYIPAKTIEELVTEAVRLKSSPKLYTIYRNKCLDKAEEYHIEKIDKMYKNIAGKRSI